MRSLPTPLPPAEQPMPTGRPGRTFPRVVIVLVLPLLAVGIAENYRGHYLWKKFRAQWEAQGEQFELTALIPKLVPPEQNFAVTPFFAPYFDYTAGTTDPTHEQRWKEQQELVSLASAGRKQPDTGRWQLANFVDLRLWQGFFAGNTNFPFATPPKDPASDVLTALRRYDGVLAELGVASARPYSAFPIHYEEASAVLLPHLGSLKAIALLVRLRAIARLEAGQPAEALQDVRMGLRLADALKSEGFLISSLVRIAMTDLALQPVWEGFARHRWNEAQLAELQTALARLNILEDYGPTLRMERATSIHFLEMMRTGHQPANLDPASFGKDYARTRFLPGGFFRQNQLAIARLYQQRILPLVNAPAHRVDVARVNQADAPGGTTGFLPYTIFAKMLVPAVSKSAERFARAQVGLDLALIACALERHRLATGHYPETFDALRPKFLTEIPPDVISGQPLHYRLVEDGQFLLYSVGWNQSDEGGTPELSAGRKRPDPSKGDWVWRYSAASAATAEP